MKKVISAALVLLILLTIAASLCVSAAVTRDNAQGDGDGYSYKLADVASSAVSESVTEDTGIANQDGINTNAATTWIIIVSAVAMIAIITMVVILSKRNKK